MNQTNEQKQIDKTEEKKEVMVPKAKYPLWLELLLDGAIILVVALLCYALINLKVFPLKEDDFKSITYSEGKEFRYSPSLFKASMVLAFVCSFLSQGLQYLIKPSGIRPTMGEKGKLFISLIILSLFGVLAYLVIALFLNGLGVSTSSSTLIASAIVSLYDIFIYKLDAEQRTYSNALFWEIFRFAIVGLVAAVFDFLTCFLLQFVAFQGNTAGYVTGISTAGGFIIGVIINYLMSTYMVYKAAKTNTAKTFKGMFLFLVLAVIGLFIGVGIQYFLYDFLYIKKEVSFLSYPIDFVLRTLIVMVYNYITRKVFIYR